MPSSTVSTRAAIVATAIPLAILALPCAARSADWPQFRGPDRTAISPETGLLREWPESGPEVLWSLEAGEGYASPAVRDGKVFFNDYDEKSSEWLVRCLSLANGKELWRFSERKRIRPNHAITRTVPAVDADFVFSIDPKNVFHCLEARTGKEVWQQNFVRLYGARIPPWYVGQCPLLEEDRVIIAPGGKVLMMALDRATGRTIWQTPDTHEMPPSHCSVMPAEFGGVKQYLHATLKGVLGVSAADGKELWFLERKFNVAMVPAPLVVSGDRVFVTSCYEAGSSMIRVRSEGGAFSAEEIFGAAEDDWNSEVHTPIFYRDHIFGIGKKKRGLFTCLDLDGKIVWTSPPGKTRFGLGGYLLADGMFYVVEGDTGTLRLIEANTTQYRELASAQVIDPGEAWGPPTLSDGKLLVRGLKKLVCLQVGRPAVTSTTE